MNEPVSFSQSDCHTIPLQLTERLPATLFVLDNQPPVRVRLSWSWRPCVGPGSESKGRSMSGAANLKLIMPGLMLLCFVSTVAGYPFDTIAISAHNAEGSGTVTLQAEDMVWSAELGGYTLPDDPLPILSRDSGHVIATVGDVYLRVPTRGRDGIEFSGYFQAGTSNTAFSMSGPVWTFDPPMDPAAARHSSEVLLSDTNGDGATFTGLGPMGGSIQSYYNGSTLFASLISEVGAPPYGTESCSEAYPAIGFEPLAGPLYDISLGVHFLVTAGDTGTFVSTLTVIPEPTAFSLLILVLAGVPVGRFR